MKTQIKALVLATVTAAAAAPAFANVDQLAASAGLTPAEAADLSISEIIHYKSNMGDDDFDGQWTVR
ncbi:MAG: hypothetical protein ACPGID_02675 [Rubricella sp.]